MVPVSDRVLVVKTWLSLRTDTVLFLPYLAIGAGCAAVALYATRIGRGTLR